MAIMFINNTTLIAVIIHKYNDAIINIVIVIIVIIIVIIVIIVIVIMIISY